MELTVEGHLPLRGEFRSLGSADFTGYLLGLAVTLPEEIILENAPPVEPVRRLLAVIETLGGQVDWPLATTLQIDTRSLNSCQFTASGTGEDLVLIGPLLARFGEVTIKTGETLPEWLNSPPFVAQKVRGGFRIKLAADIPEEMLLERADPDHIFAIATAWGGRELSLTIPEGPVHYHLVKLGEIFNWRWEGRVLKLNPATVDWGGRRAALESRREIIFAAMLALATGGEVTIPSAHLDGITKFFSRLAAWDLPFERTEDCFRIWLEKAGAAVERELTITEDPDFPLSWIYLLLPAATQLNGVFKFSDPQNLVKPSFVQSLNMIGAKITDADLGGGGKLYQVNGPQNLRGARLDPGDLNGGLGLLLAALAAEGKSEIFRGEMLTENIGNLIERLEGLGAKVIPSSEPS